MYRTLELLDIGLKALNGFSGDLTIVALEELRDMLLGWVTGGLCLNNCKSSKQGCFLVSFTEVFSLKFEYFFLGFLSTIFLMFS
jgi:hypothetical protein